MQDAGDTTVPADVQEKLLQFARAGLAAASMRGASYLAMGAVSMGIAGSIVDPRFLESWLGMRYEMVDMSEFTRRIDEKIYDPEEFTRALAWVKQNCTEGRGPQSGRQSSARAPQKDADWEFVVKMTLIGRDLMVGNPRLAELGFGEEALGHNAIASGFQGQRQWTDHFPNGDFMETMLNTSFDWNGIREAFVCATENDYLQRHLDALRPPAHRHGADLLRRAHVLEPGCGEAGDGKEAHGGCGGRRHPPHQFRLHDAGRHRQAEPRTGSPS